MNQEELKNIYILFIRSILEQSAAVWHSSLTEENKNNLERVQKSAVRIITGDKNEAKIMFKFCTKMCQKSQN